MEHLDKMIKEKSIEVLAHYKMKTKNKFKEIIKIDRIKFPKLGSLTYCRPMIEENENSEIKLPSSIVSTLNNQVQMNEFQTELCGLLSNYKDLLYTNESFENQDDIQQAYVIHILNHLMNSRSKLIANNKVFEKKNSSEYLSYDNLTLRDQGYTRPKILFLLPFRYSALRLGKCIVKILGSDYNNSHLDRFIQEFGDEDGVDSCQRPICSDGNKPLDYYQTFHGNTDDAFRVGLKLTKKSLKFFSEFYDSDIIIASPLGLKTIITPEEDQAIANETRDQAPASGDRDFLSSIEIIVLDQSEVFLMQNWEHLLDVMRHINIMPSKPPKKMDINRIRPWHLEDLSKYYRQLIMFSSTSVLLIHGFFQSHASNYEGHLTYQQRIDNPYIRRVTSKCTQYFLYYDSPSAKDACDIRFSFFTRQVLPKLIGSGSDKGDKESLDHTLIFIPSYFDYVRMRNYFRREKLSFAQICEYTDDNKVSKARQLFYFGARQFLLYTERCHFYHRYKIKGVRRVIFYEPPTLSKFYNEIVDLMAPELQGKKFLSGQMKPFGATTLFTNHDILQLGALVGYGNATRLIQNKQSIK